MATDKVEKQQGASTLERIASEVGQIRKKTETISGRIDDTYHVLQDILEAVNKNGGDDEWYDLYENGRHFD